MVLLKRFIFLLLAIVLFVSCSVAENTSVWVLCQPDSYVNIRPFASKRHDPCGIMECGWDGETDGTTKNGYILVYSISTEAGCGWIKKGYIVYSKPIVHTYNTNIYSKGRVACWRSIGGNRRCWAKNGDCITVYATSEEWAVTNKGFIRTEYLGVDYNQLLKLELEDGQSDTESIDLHWEHD